jgi:RNA polymerase sigma-70 factor, ECF subfamily
MDKDPDARLVRACRNGDRVAFETLLARYERTIFNLAVRMLRNPDDASDVTQATFLRAFENLHQFDFQHRFYSWIYRIAINESINCLNHRNRYIPLDDDGVDESCGPHDAYGSAQLGARVQAAIMRLSPDYRAVIVLRHFTECSYHDMAEILGIPEKTVKSRLFTARQQLRELLETAGAGNR